MGEDSELSMELLALRQQAYAYVNEARTSLGLSPVRLGKTQLLSFMLPNRSSIGPCPVGTWMG